MSTPKTSTAFTVPKAIKILFGGGTPPPAGSDEPHCFDFTSPNTVIRFRLDQDPPTGCMFVTTAFLHDPAGGLSVVDTPLAHADRRNCQHLVSTAVAASSCAYFTLAVSLHCPNMPTRLVEVAEFKICNPSC